MDRLFRLQQIEATRISRYSAYESSKVISPTHQPLLLSGDTAGSHLFQKSNLPQGRSATRRIKALKNLNDLIGNQTRYLTVCIAVPQPTVLPLALFS